MAIFLASLAGIPPLAGWIGKFTAFKAVIGAGTTWAYLLAVIAAVNSVIAFGYYGNVMREMWMKPAPDGDETPIKPPTSLWAALGITGVATVVLGVLPGLVMRFGDLQSLTGAFGRYALPRRCCASTSSSTSRSTDPRASTPPAVAPAAAATSSPRRRSGRCSAPCWRVPSTHGGQRPAVPNRSPSSTQGPARARSPER